MKKTLLVAFFAIMGFAVSAAVKNPEKEKHFKTEYKLPGQWKCTTSYTSYLIDGDLHVYLNIDCVYTNY